MPPENPHPIPDVNLFHCTVPVDVRWRDLDPMMHVNNAVYMSYFEYARVGYWREVTRGEQLAFSFILASAAITYHAPAFLSERLLIHIRVAHVGTKSFEFEYLITRETDGQTIASGKSVQVCYDYERKITTPVSTKLRERIEAIEGHIF